MNGSKGNGNGNEVRSGAQTLALLASPLDVQILRVLSSGSRPQLELQRECGSPAQTTLRTQLKRLEAVGAIERRRHEGFPGIVDYELSDAGRGLLSVATVLERWLQSAPEGPIELGGSTAKAAITALVEGWSTRIMRALAAKPLTLTELDGVISAINYPSLQRRLGTMRLAGQVEARPGEGRGTPYGVTGWLRQGIAPLAAAARWERLHLGAESPPITSVDIEAAFLLAMPLVRLADPLSGSCRMAVEVGKVGRCRLAGVLVEADTGRIAACTTRLEGTADAWASGSQLAWLATVIQGDPSRLELGGDCGLARSLLKGLHEALIASRTPA